MIHAWSVCVHYAEAKGELTREGLMLLWQFKAKYAHVVLPTPHTRNYVHSTCYTLPSQPIDCPCQYQFLQEIKSSLPIQIYFTRSLTKWELKHTKIEHCINILHSPLLLPPHEVMNMAPHAAGEGSETQLNNSTYKYNEVGVDSSKSHRSYLQRL